MEDLRLAVVCASNNNRSMEAHKVLAKKGLNVRSYGISSKVKMPGPAANKPNVYDFGTPYEVMLRELEAKDPDLYRQNGVLHMLKRNKTIKLAPERFQDDEEHKFDIVITYEDRVFEALLEHMTSRGSDTFEPVHVVNLHVVDNHESAAIGALDTFTFLRMLQQAGIDEWEDNIEDVIEEFQKKEGKRLLHQVCFY
eukprot:TRINITY_DN3791_c0_g1_i1.p1 TRINITY_DN3791_c0_g1~~TRINITY_DN3791_c0_g1_i1.p1  ORF type:complete len:225 (-),score=62.11 TRINITY_DN3791_c0_g1_i1:132-719(-)